MPHCSYIKVSHSLMINHTDIIGRYVHTMCMNVLKHCIEIKIKSVMIEKTGHVCMNLLWVCAFDGS